MKKIIIYTDGACSCNPGVGGYGAVLIYGEHKKEIHGACEKTTNNRMELAAAIESLNLLKEPCDVVLYSDSAYLVNAINDGWLKEWSKNNWHKKGKLIKNSDLWEKIVSLMKIHQIKFVKVKGHSDNFYNNRCDYLARLSYEGKK